MVDLVGVVHIGDEKYYAEINNRLSRYDLVLFEFIGDPSNIRNYDCNKSSMRIPLSEGFTVGYSALQC